MIGKHCHLVSSHGSVTFDTRTGVVVDVHEDTDEPGCLKRIYRVDVDRLRGLLGGLDADDEIDILFAGHWFVTDRGSTCYEQPDEEAIREFGPGRRTP